MQASTLSRDKLELLNRTLSARGIRPGAKKGIPARTSRGPLPLSYAQERIWFLCQMEPESTFYNMPLVLRLEGRLDISALELSVQEIVRRHEILRTRFESVNGVPRQVIESEVEGKMELSDLSDLNSLKKQRELDRLVTEEARQPFALDTGKLLRSRLVRLEDEKHVALFTMHHIVSDGWSLGVMVDELGKLYGAYSAGLESPLKPLELQYGDYAVWQREWLAGEELERQLGFWREQLADLPVLELPTDYSRPAVQSHRGGIMHFELDRDLSAALREVSHQEGVTLFMIMLAAFEVLLARYSGQRQIVVGTPVANRNRTETEPLIGFFVNTLVLRGDLRGNPAFRELLKRVRRSTLEAYAHQDVPFEKLVREVQPQRDPSRSPLFQVMFALQSAPLQSVQLNGIRTEVLEGSSDTSKFDLLATVAEREGRLSVTTQYSSDLFHAETIERLHKHYKQILASVAEDPGRPIFDAPMITEEERKWILERSGRSAKDLVSGQTISELFADQVQRIPDAVALVEGARTVSYRELNRQSNRWANALRSLGLHQEQIAGVRCNRSSNAVVAFLSIVKAGGAYLPIDEAPLERIEQMLEEASAHILLIDDEYPAPQFQRWQNRILTLSDLDRLSLAMQEDDLRIFAGTRNLVCVMYTSGSTGRPKGVMVSHAAVTRLVKCTNYLDFNQISRVAHVSASAFDASLFEIWGALLNGGGLVILSRDEVLSRERLEEAIELYSIDTMFLTTALFNRMSELAPGMFRPLTNLIFGGEVAQGGTAAKVLRAGKPARLINVYGPTENTTFSTWYEVTGVGERSETLPIGSPVTNTDIYILNEEMELQGVGLIGELYVGGAGLARGYLNQPSLTADRFVPHPFGPEGDRLYRTGDFARYSAGEQLEFVGRKDEQVKIRGFRVEVEEIEALLSRAPGVSEAAVAVNANSVGEKYLAGYVVPRMPPGIDSLQIQRHLRDRLPVYMVPSQITVIERMPLTANGKVDKRALREINNTNELPPAPQSPPQTRLQVSIADVWRKVLEVETVGIHQNFFELGGHSLALVSVHQRLQEELQRPISIVSLFQNPTIYLLAEALGEETTPAPVVGEEFLSRAKKRWEAQNRMSHRARVK